MSKTRKLLSVVACLVLALSVALVGCGGGSTPAPAASGSADSGQAASGAAELKTVTPGVITVASDCDYPPFIEMDGDKPAGFEKEMLDALGAAVGYEIVYLAPQNFDSILAGVAAGVKMDIGVSSFTITDERKELVDFATPYFDSNQACVTLITKDYATAMDLNGKTVGSQSGTTGSDWVNENLKDPGTTLKEYNQTSEVMAALVAGDIEAAFYDEPVAVDWTNGIYKEQAKVVQSIATGEQYGFAVSKDNPALLALLNDGLQKIKASGEFDTIFAKWFPGVPAPSLSPAA